MATAILVIVVVALVVGLAKIVMPILLAAAIFYLARQVFADTTIGDVLLSGGIGVCVFVILLYLLW